MEKLGALLD